MGYRSGIARPKFEADPSNEIYAALGELRHGLPLRIPDDEEVFCVRLLGGGLGAGVITGKVLGPSLLYAEDYRGSKALKFRLFYSQTRHPTSFPARAHHKKEHLR